MPGDTLIEVRDLTKRYGGVVALADMNLTVERGTVHAVVGENGAGKSTLMKILAGAVHPDSGTIRIAGETVTLDSPNACAEARHRHRLPGTQPLPRALGARQPLRQPRAVHLRLRVDPDDGGREPRPARPPWPPCRRACAGRPADHRRAPAGRARPRPPRGAAADHPRRAQLGAERARDAAALRRAPPAPDARPYHALRLAPARGGVRHLRPGDDHPERPRCPDQGPQGPHHPRGDRGHDRRPARPDVPAAAAADGPAAPTTGSSSRACPAARSGTST